MADVRDEAEKWLDKNVPDGKNIFSDGATANDFTTITSLTHAGLIKQWKTQESKPPGTRSVVTSCNSFAGEYSRTTYKAYLGGIDPHDMIKKMGKDYAWVAATDDARPKKGDIVKGKGQHVFVSLEFKEDGSWVTVQGGQGGPTYADKPVEDTDGGKSRPLVEAKSRDLVKRIVKKKYEAKDLEGWIDLEVFLNGPPAPPAAPPSQQPDGGTTGQLWQNEDGTVAHPDSPAGGGGPGNFRPTGVVAGDPFDPMASPWSPAAKSIDPIDLQDLEGRNA